MRGKSLLYTTTIISSVVVSGLWGSLAFAADAAPGSMPAVSAFNGKIEFGGGWADADLFSSDEQFYGAGSLSMPLGDSFGLQLDAAAKDVFGETLVGGAAHLFYRDPASYLFGGIGGWADVGLADVAWAGGEAEFYLDRVSFEVAAGYMNTNPNSGSNKDDLFAFGDIAFYPVDNLRLAIGASSVADFESASASMEYLLDAAPVSLKAEVRAGEDDFVAASLGVSFYFGGDDSSKSLIRRHREDDPRNRVLDVFGAAGSFGPNDLLPDCTGEFPPPACYL